MKKRIIIESKLFFFLLILLAAYKSNAQNNASAFAAADTVNFSKNTSGNWELYNSYVVAFSSDSVRLELILQHDNNVNWAQEQYAGKIKPSNLRPATQKTISFLFGEYTYQIRIETGGKCYLKLVSGTPPSNEPVVIPLAIKFKK